jgi:hypothetical protein
MHGGDASNITVRRYSLLTLSVWSTLVLLVVSAIAWIVHDGQGDIEGIYKGSLNNNTA